MDYHMARHNLLSANLAHVDTPNYRSRELYRVESFDEVLAGRMNVSNGKHFGSSGRSASWQVGVDRFSPVGPDGNAVNLDREAVKVASNTLRYDTLSTLVQSNMGMLALAARDAR